jgi:hypothetical protein
MQAPNPAVLDAAPSVELAGSAVSAEPQEEDARGDFSLGPVSLRGTKLGPITFGTANTNLRFHARQASTRACVCACACAIPALTCCCTWGSGVHHWLMWRLALLAAAHCHGDHLQSVPPFMTTLNAGLQKFRVNDKVEVSSSAPYMKGVRPLMYKATPSRRPHACGLGSGSPSWHPPPP